jgi:hypothetical protein
MVGSDLPVKPVVEPPDDRCLTVPDGVTNDLGPDSDAVLDESVDGYGEELYRSNDGSRTRDGTVFRKGRAGERYGNGAPRLPAIGPGSTSVRGIRPFLIRNGIGREGRTVRGRIRYRCPGAVRFEHAHPRRATKRAEARPTAGRSRWRTGSEATREPEARAGASRAFSPRFCRAASLSLGRPWKKWWSLI